MDVNLRSNFTALQVDRESRLHAQVHRVVSALPARQLQVLAHEVARLVPFQSEPPRLEILEIPVELGHQGYVLGTVGIAAVERDLKFIQRRLNVILWLILWLRNICLVEKNCKTLKNVKKMGGREKKLPEVKW